MQFIPWLYVECATAISYDSQWGSNMHLAVHFTMDHYIITPIDSSQDQMI